MHTQYKYNLNHSLSLHDYATLITQGDHQQGTTLLLHRQVSLNMKQVHNNHGIKSL